MANGSLATNRGRRQKAFLDASTETGLVERGLAVTDLISCYVPPGKSLPVLLVRFTRLFARVYLRQKYIASVGIASHVLAMNGNRSESLARRRGRLKATSG